MRNPSFAWERVEFCRTWLFGLGQEKRTKNQKTGLQKSHNDWIRDQWTSTQFLDLNQESRVPLNYLFKICSFLFPFLSCLSHKRGKKGPHAAWIWDPLFNYPTVWEKKSLTHKWWSWGFQRTAGIFFLVSEHMMSPLYLAQSCHSFVCLFQCQELFLWLARGESWPILEPYTTPQPLTQRSCNSHGFMWSCFIGRALCEVLLGRQFHPWSWESDSSCWGRCWICSDRSCHAP